MSKRKVSVEDKIYAVNLYLDGKESQRRIADMFDVSFASVQQWIRNYESMGANAFTLKGNKKYSKELKQQQAKLSLLPLSKNCRAQRWEKGFNCSSPYHVNRDLSYTKRESSLSGPWSRLLLRYQSRKDNQ